jgi:NADH-quinone oxidoreductase subunit J
VAPIAGPLFNEYLLAFEITSILLLAAIVGAVVLGRQRGEDLAR